MTLKKKHMVFNPMTGGYTYFDNESDVEPQILKNALEMYYANSYGAHHKIVYVDENGVEFENPEGRIGADGNPIQVNILP